MDRSPTLKKKISPTPHSFVKEEINDQLQNAISLVEVVQSGKIMGLHNEDNG